MTTGQLSSSSASEDPTSDDATKRLYLVVARLSRSLRRRGDMHGLGHGAVSALATLVVSDAMRLGDLAAKEGVAAPTLSRMIAALVDKGYVAREPDPADGRASLVAPTELGRAMIMEMRSSRMQELHRRLGRLDQAQRQTLFEALNSLETLISDD
ncbi:MarR family winged helix-turn-helix transcriptional regulator [Sciscionella marina]|uniref:MarR family winged helix-turn-helix transcriptional regulator n=1 Tax=Sciscionella marina TaxID=508770 RepID=UPI00036328EA|nr:MarR family transcriptional regulator [Sciscionella marina]